MREGAGFGGACARGGGGLTGCAVVVRRLVGSLGAVSSTVARRPLICAAAPIADTARTAPTPIAATRREMRRRTGNVLQARVGVPLVNGDKTVMVNETLTRPRTVAPVPVFVLFDP